MSQIHTYLGMYLTSNIRYSTRYSGNDPQHVGSDVRAQVGTAVQKDFSRECECEVICMLRFPPVLTKTCARELHIGFKKMANTADHYNGNVPTRP